MADLFRQEVIDRQSQRLLGEVVIEVPPVLRWAALLIFGLVGATLILLALGTYARTETVTGFLTPDKGLIRVIARESGVIEEMLVSEGQFVGEGMPIARLALDTQSRAGRPLTADLLDGLARQETGLAAAGAAEREEMQGQAESLRARIRSIDAELGQIDALMQSQKERMRLLKDDLTRAETLAERGFVAGAELRRRREALLIQEQAGAELDLRRITLAREQADARGALRQLVWREVQARAILPNWPNSLNGEPRPVCALV